MIRNVAVATQALFLLLLVITPYLALAHVHHHGGGKKPPVKKPVGGSRPRKPATPYRPTGRPAPIPGVKVLRQPPIPGVRKPRKPMIPKKPGFGLGGPGTKGGHGIRYNGGPLFTGEVNLNIIFYGQWQNRHKDLIRSFINSIAIPGSDACRWWGIVERYQGLANKGRGPIRIKVAGQVSDDRASLGKVITKDYIKMLMQNSKSKTPNSVVVIFAHADVAVSELCRGKCYDHGLIENYPFLIVGNPTIECPGACGIPFTKASYGPPLAVVKPPNGDLGVDATIMNFAAGLASVVTNPFMTGFSKKGHKRWQIEAGNACENILGSGGGPGNIGRIKIDHGGCGYNAVGEMGLKFMLPALWDPTANNCWTTV